VKYANLSEPKALDMEFLNFVRGRPDHLCRLACGAQKIDRNGQCVPRDEESAKPSAHPIEAKEPDHRLIGLLRLRQQTEPQRPERGAHAWVLFRNATDCTRRK
jgi:hypothetical protein